MNLGGRLLRDQDPGAAFDTNRTFHIVAPKQARSALHENQMCRLARIQNARDLEGYFTIGVAKHGLAVLQDEGQIHTSAPSDFRESNTHGQFSKISSWRIQCTTLSTPSRVF